MSQEKVQKFMNWSEFKTRVPGKWVLTGEHAVLKGLSAVALPHLQTYLSLAFHPDFTQESLEVDPPKAERFMKEMIEAISDQWEVKGASFSKPSGKLSIQSTIPIGAGLGSSAALCVALTQWMVEPLVIPPDQIVEFATQLEHRFHGQSSGMDVAVIAAREPICFSMEKGIEPIGIKVLPKFTFHDTGLRSRTNECVAKVENFRKEAPALALHVDEQMGKASRLAIEGLIQFDSGNHPLGLQGIQQAMHLARECFYSWELVPGKAKRMEEELLRQGALAVKLTGAGGGGMLVALWPDN